MPACTWCGGRGWSIVNDDGDYHGHIQRCDGCALFATDDDAIKAAVAVVWRDQDKKEQVEADMEKCIQATLMIIRSTIQSVDWLAHASGLDPDRRVAVTRALDKMREAEAIMAEAE